MRWESDREKSRTMRDESTHGYVPMKGSSTSRGGYESMGKQSCVDDDEHSKGGEEAHRLARMG